MAWKSRKNSDPERRVEEYLVDKVMNLGGLAWKFTSPGNIGVPDRFVTLNGMVCFVELKRPKGGIASPMQLWRIHQLLQQGVNAYIIKNTDQVDELITELLNGRYPEVEDEYA